MLTYDWNNSERLHINSTFPIDNVLVRNPEGAPARGLYLVNDLVKGVVQANNYERLRLTTAGTKVFTKQDSGTAQTISVMKADGTVETQENKQGMFRVLGEGLPVVLPFVEPKWVIQGDMATLRTLVESYYPLCAVFDEPFKSVIEARRECYSFFFIFPHSSFLIE
jgi:multisite-specific tRNA:(cytosine-C5)-methyltransferase